MEGMISLLMFSMMLVRACSEAAMVIEASRAEMLPESAKPLLPTVQETRGFSFAEATTTMFNCMVGSSILALPFAINKCGFFGFLMLGGVACVMGFTACLIGTNLSIVAELPEGRAAACHDWSLIGSIAFGPVGKSVISVLFLCDLSSALVTFLIASGINLPLVFPQFLTPLSGTIVSGVIAFFMLYVPVRVFAYVSMLGIIAQLVMFVNLLITGAVVYEETPELIAKDFKFINPAAVTGMLGAYIGCFNAHSTVPTIYQNVEDKSRWSGIVFSSTVMAVVFYSVIGLVCYGAFGNDIPQSFTANLGRNIDGELLEGFEFMAPLSAGLIATKMLVTVPAMSRPILAFLETRASFSQGVVGNMLVKAVLTTAVTMVAILGRDMLPYVTAIRGAVVQVLIAILMPQVAFIVLQWDKLGSARRVVLLLVAACLYLVTVPGAIEDIRLIAAAK